MKQTLIIIGLFVSGLAFGQESKIDNFLTEIQKYDISDLLTLKKEIVRIVSLLLPQIKIESNKCLAS